MNTSQTCPNCGKPLPEGALEGLCPECMLKVGAVTESVPPTEFGPGGTVVVPPPSDPPTPMPRIGGEFGNYRILRRLGHGGMGVVYEAEEQESGRRVALKVINQKLNSPADRARFLREGRLAASINHPNCVYVYGTEEIEGTPVIAMEFVPGGTLQQRLSRKGPLPVPQAVDAILQVIAGLEAGLAVGILHRDIKPSNCFEEPNGTVKIGDFGLSISTAARAETNITETGAMVGTPAFCPPEQLRGEELSARSDMYAVGVTLFYLLTGKLPFEGQTMPQLIANTLEKRSPTPQVYRQEIPTGLARAIVRCLDKQPSERFKNYADLRRVLEPYASAAPTPATLGLRLLAGITDLIVLSLIGLVVMLVFVGNPFAVLERFYQSTWSALQFMLPWFVFWIAYYAVAEWRWGATPGKALCHLRVLRPDRNYPGLPQALSRAMIYNIVPVLPYWIIAGRDPLAFTGPSVSTYALSFSYYVLLGLLFASVRRRNGFAAIHDLATNTRVVSRAATEQRQALAVTDLQPAGVEAFPKVGPYHVLEALGTSGRAEWVEAYDLRLLRRVLIRKVPPGTPSLPAAVHNISRVGRLRWLTGRREANENWDAFEGVGGRPLLKLVEQPQPWSRVRFWLHDLAEELGAAEKDGSLPSVLALDRVWITREGRAKLLDFPAPGIGDTLGRATQSATDEPDMARREVPLTRPSGTLSPSGEQGWGEGAHLLAEDARDAQPPVFDAATTAREFVGKVAAISLGGWTAKDQPASTVPGITPLHARRFLEAASTMTSADAIAAALKPLLRRAAEVTRLRRTMIVTCCVAFPLVASLGAIFGISLMQRWQQENPGVMELSQVLNTWRAKHMPFVPKSTLPSDRLIGIYIAAHYGGVITNEDAWSSALARLFIPADAREFAEQSLEQYASPTAEELKEADKRLEPIARQARPGNSPPARVLSPLVLWSCLLIYVGIPAVIAALLFRGGLVLLATGVTYARRDGVKASRLRVLWRSVVTWTPVLGAMMLCGVAMQTKSMVPVLLGTFAVIVLAVWSLWLPERGLQDRLAGTWPVPR